MNETPRHKVFISFHHKDQQYKERFTQMMGPDFIDQSVDDGDIDDERLSTETIREKIRDQFIRDATVTVVLVGPCTWQRKHVDWEIGSSLRKSRRNPRCGLLGILLPNHFDHGTDHYHPQLVPPRLADNCGVNDYSPIFNWSNNSTDIRGWIHRAFERRSGTPPANSRPQFKYNRSGSCSEGWKD